MSAADPLQVQVIRPGQTYVGKQGFTYGAGASAETVGARHICMNVLPMPPGARAKVHYHERIETIAYMLEGECVVRFGDRMQRAVQRERRAVHVAGGALVGERSGRHRAAAGTGRGSCGPVAGCCGAGPHAA